LAKVFQLHFLGNSTSTLAAVRSPRFIDDAKPSRFQPQAAPTPAAAATRFVSPRWVEAIQQGCADAPLEAGACE